MTQSLAPYTILHQYLSELYLNAGGSVFFTFTNVVLENIEKRFIPYKVTNNTAEPTDWSEFTKLDTLGLIKLRHNRCVDLEESLIDLAKSSDVQNVQDLQEKINDMIEHDTSQITLKVCEFLKDQYKEIKPTMISVESEGSIMINLSYTPYSTNKKLINDLIDLAWVQMPFLTIGTSTLPHKILTVSFDVHNSGLREIVYPYEIYYTKNTIPSLRID